MSVLKLGWGEPVEVSLRFPSGKRCESQYGGVQYLYSVLCGGEQRAMYVSEDGATAIDAKKLKVGEPFSICRYRGGKWDVERKADLATRKVAEGGTSPQPSAPAPALVPMPPQARPANHAASVDGTAEAFKVAVDALRDAVLYAKQQGLRVETDAITITDIRAVAAMLIQRDRNEREVTRVVA